MLKVKPQSPEWNPWRVPALLQGTSCCSPLALLLISLGTGSRLRQGCPKAALVRAPALVYRKQVLLQDMAGCMVFELCCSLLGDRQAWQACSFCAMLQIGLQSQCHCCYGR